MATRSSLFVDTSGWAYLFDRNSDFHQDVQLVYQQAIARNRLLVTTNYILAELVALLSSRSRISRQGSASFRVRCRDAIYRVRMGQAVTLADAINRVPTPHPRFSPGRMQISRQKIIAFVDALKTTPHVEVIHIDTNLDASAWVLLKTYIDKEWSLVDASSFVIMTNYGMTEAITTDHHFTQAGFVRLPVQ